MELEFDKEIDALMRKGATDSGVLVGDRPKGHLDADELAAFAENAMPGKTRSLHMAHLADCDRCRRILSGLVMLNAEAEPEKATAAAPTVSATAEPWYRRFFLFPNLAYVMGGLVLMFGGLLTFSLLQNNASDGGILTQVTESETGRGPMAAEPNAGTTYDISANTANTASNTASAAATNSNSSMPSVASSNATGNASLPVATAPPGSDREAVTAESGRADVLLDSVQPAAPPPAPVPAEAPKDKDEEAGRKSDLANEKELKKRSAAEDDRTADVTASRQAQAAPRTQAGGPMKAKPGPTRDAQETFPNRANNTFEMPETRRLSGRTFQFRNNAWYDSAYRGQATTNVRRGSEEYKKLDGGIRSIAQKLDGVVVVVWKDKAYRIQ